MIFIDKSKNIGLIFEQNQKWNAQVEDVENPTAGLRYREHYVGFGEGRYAQTKNYIKSLNKISSGSREYGIRTKFKAT